MLAYSILGASCWVAGLASPNSKERIQRAHSSSNYSHTAVIYLKSSMNTLGLVVEAILVALTCGTVTMDTAGDVVD